MVMAFSGHWKLRLINNVYQVCLPLYSRSYSILDFVKLSQAVKRSSTSFLTIRRKSPTEFGTPNQWWDI
ncbi:MAG: hypothetical protein ACLBM6_04070, partial [Cuspidothrix sp.]